MEKNYDEMSADEKIDNALNPMVDFPMAKYCYCQCMDDQSGIDAIKSKYQAMKVRCDDYKAQVAAAKDEAAVEVILGSITRE